nr:aminotransferase class I/II-fold pyridoxal phosphate-dependent enzyme [Staphylococcus warneri]
MAAFTTWIRNYYRVDWDRVEQAITSKTRMLVINFPHNPTCTILQPQDLDALEQIVEKHPSLIILSDEVYEHLTFDQKEHLSLATRPLLAERAVIVSSFGKTFHATGWKVGYCCAPASLSTEIRKVHQYTVFTVPSPLQAGLATYMQDPATWESLPAFYQEKRDHLHQGLQNTRFTPMPSEGTFFLLASYEHISELSELDFAKHLNQNYGVGAIPVSAFYLNPNSELMVGRTVPFVTGQYTTTGDGASNPFQTIQREDVGLTLKVRPQISEGGTVKMALYQEVSSLDPTMSVSPSAPVTRKRALSTNVLVDDGQIIVLGGLLEDSIEDGQQSVPLLGDIPLVGNLFKYEKRKRSKTNLMVFLRPHIVRNAQDSQSLSLDRYNYMRAVQTGLPDRSTWFHPDAGHMVLPQAAGSSGTVDLRETL